MPRRFVNGLRPTLAHQVRFGIRADPLCTVHRISVRVLTLTTAHHIVIVDFARPDLPDVSRRR